MIVDYKVATTKMPDGTTAFVIVGAAVQSVAEPITVKYTLQVDPAATRDEVDYVLTAIRKAIERNIKMKIHGL